MFQPIRTDPPPDQVRRITFVPFLIDGRCVLIDEPGGPALPSGEVLDGEHYLLDTVLRVPLQTAGFRYQRFHPFGLDRDHLYAWIEGGPYTGGRPHRTAALRFCSAEEAARWLGERGEPVLAAAVQAAAGSYRTLDEEAELARRRLPRWADRIWAGNAADWRPPGGMRFDYVHILLDCVPAARRADLVRQHLAHTVEPGTGRLLVSDYAADPAAGHPPAAETLRSLGFRCAGQTSGGDRPGRPPAPTAWIAAP